MRTNMKTIQLLTAITVATLTLAACSEEEKLPGDNWDGRIHISSNVATLTRATHNLDEQIANNEKVWLYVDKTVESSTTSEIYDKELTANGSGEFTGDDNMFFPADATSISLYALHVNAIIAEGVAESRPTDFPGTVTLTHKVEQNQKSSDGNYAKSDLLFAKVVSKSKKDVKDASGKIELDFKHLLSKIEVVLKKGTGMGSEITIEKVEILNTQLKCSFTPSKSDAITLNTSSDAINNGNSIEIDNGVTTDNGNPVLNEAIIIPQTVTSGTEFIKITLSSGGTLVYKIGESGVTFAAQNKYKYTITANLTGLEVTSKITAWTHDNKKDVTGDAGM